MGPNDAQKAVCRFGQKSQAGWRDRPRYGEPEAEGLASRLEGNALAAPALIEYELGNTCWKKRRRYPKLVKALTAGLEAVGELDLQLHDVDLIRVLQLAMRRDVTFYDASYLWLAQQLNAELLTLDERLAP